MEEFSALAARVAASVVELRGCLILSRDGLVLGAFPGGQEDLVKTAWLKFAVLGEPEKGFVEFGDEIWTYVRRGPYAAFAVSELGIRPGLLMDQLDQALYAAEELRVRREALRVPDAAPMPSGRPLTSLNPDVQPPGTPASLESEIPVAAGASAPPEQAEAAPEIADEAATEPNPPEPADGPGPAPPRVEDDGTEVDRFALAQELSKLLQESQAGDENQ
jgi:hypothetical protein